MKIYNTLMLSLCSLFISISACDCQSLGDRLSSYVVYLSKENSISMVIDVTMKNESGDVLETSKMEYVKKGKHISTRMGNKVFLFDQQNAITLNVDLDIEALSIGEATSSDVVSKQLRSLILMFDESKDLFEVRESIVNSKYQFDVFVQSEIIASYTFTENNRLEEVIFHKNVPQKIEGKVVHPRLFMRFSYDKKVNIPGVLKYLQKKGDKWYPLAKYEEFNFYDGQSNNSNE